MNIFTKIFDKNLSTTKNGENTMIKELSIEEQKATVLQIMNFYNTDGEKLFANESESTIFSEAVIYLQFYNRRRVSLSEVVCFFLRKNKDIQTECFKIFESNYLEYFHQFAENLLYLIDSNSFKNFKNRISKLLLSKRLIFPDFRTFKVRGIFETMLEIKSISESELQINVGNPYAY